MEKKHKIQIITIALGMLLVASAVFLFWNSQTGKDLLSGQLSFPLKADVSTGVSESSSESSTEEPETIITPEVQEQLIKSELNRTYFHPKYKFSFQYPGELNVSAFQEGEYGETVLVQKPDERAGFQIFIAPFDEAGPMTKERILQDLPDMVVEEPQQVIIGQDPSTGSGQAITALIFFSHEPSLGKTREVWFIHGGYLYQLSTYAGLDGFIGRILETWKFQ